jgi:hypothetical protein
MWSPHRYRVRLAVVMMRGGGGGVLTATLLQAGACWEKDVGWGAPWPCVGCGEVWRVVPAGWQPCRQSHLPATFLQQRYTQDIASGIHAARMYTEAMPRHSVPHTHVVPTYLCIPLSAPTECPATQLLCHGHMERWRWTVQQQ